MIYQVTGNSALTKYDMNLTARDQQLFFCPDVKDAGKLLSFPCFFCLFLALPISLSLFCNLSPLHSFVYLRPSVVLSLSLSLSFPLFYSLLLGRRECERERYKESLSHTLYLSSYLLECIPVFPF